MSLAYYPGCSLHGTSREYDESFRTVSAALGISLREIDDWSCCGASSAHPVDRTLAAALPARNLALAEAQGADEVVAPCAACFNRLASARHDLAADPDLAAHMPEILGCSFENKVAVRNVVDLLADHAAQIDEIATAQLAPRPLGALKVAAYYGCLLVRPAEITGCDDPEQPQTMEKIIAACGAAPVKWNLAVECCGGGFSISRPSSVLRLGRSIIQDARRNGATVIVVACPLCHSNLDLRQAAMALRGEEPMPILFITQLVGLALGLPEERLGLTRHFVDTQPLLASVPLADRTASGSQATSMDGGRATTAGGAGARVEQPATAARGTAAANSSAAGRSATTAQHSPTGAPRDSRGER